jgi:choline dehydrogenase-like flavoprotein
MNAMLYVRGRPIDYDLWDVPGWRWDDVRPYFLKAEDNARGASEHHATGGPLRVEDERSRGR